MSGQALTGEHPIRTCDNTIHRMDFGIWKELNQQIQEKSRLGLDAEILESYRHG
jgi:hypothetical protein